MSVNTQPHSDDRRSLPLLRGRFGGAVDLLHLLLPLALQLSPREEVLEKARGLDGELYQGKEEEERRVKGYY